MKLKKSSKKMKKLINPSSILVTLLIVVILFFSVKKSYKEYLDKNKIKSNPKITFGYITDYYEIGLANYYLDYQYSVDGNLYKKEVSSDVIYKKCEYDNWCINKKIYVRYFVDDPSISEPILDSIVN
ncbi:hypothetical protein DMB65_02820 [Flavobacterium cheongpyeongense]|uniref:DUF3592 domain-containing protein n=2 Tax=Flavobacterium cheongpyeongense TaxID=2212651 RepID=A0A2V4C7K7_9FLAO|nr:hypothetical protein DMB65_02820 [Flavobacterium cheongpyeongense]